MKPMARITACFLVLGLAVWTSATAVTVSTDTRDPDGISKFYAQYPELQDFYPMGIYGLFTGWNELAGEKTRGELSFELYNRYNINAVWYTTPFMKPSPPEEKPDGPTRQIRK